MKPPLVFDWDGDLGIYRNLESMLNAIEPNDLTSKRAGVKNRLAYDSAGLKFLLALNDPQEIKWTNKWDLKYPAKVYQLNEKPNPEELRRLLESWQDGMRKYYSKRHYPKLENPTLEELVSFADAYGLIEDLVHPTTTLDLIIDRSIRIWFQNLFSVRTLRANHSSDSANKK